MSNEMNVMVEELEIVAAPKAFLPRDYTGQYSNEGFWTYDFVAGTWGWEPA